VALMLKSFFGIKDAPKANLKPPAFLGDHGHTSAVRL
jgi:hypothetical protein